MSSSIRPIRRAAQLAAIRINEFVQADNANSDSDDSPKIVPNDGLTRARQNGYDDTIFITRYLLKQCEDAKYEDERTKIAEQLFEVINANPNILIFEPKFRTMVQEKAKEFEEHLTSRADTYTKTQYQKALKMMMVSMRKNVRNSTMRDRIYKHISEISKILNEYDTWVVGKSLKTQIAQLNTTLNNIKNHPSYVMDNYITAC
jgi:hypothetical protein